MIIQLPGLSTAAYPICVADRVLVQRDDARELRSWLGQAFNDLDPTARDVLAVAYRHQLSQARHVSAKQAAFALWHDREAPAGDIEELDTFYRKGRNTFNKVQTAGFLEKVDGTHGYLLRQDFKGTQLL